MKINCNQFEGLLSFYIDGELSESLKQTFEEHLSECPHCNMKYKVISSIITDIKGAYSKLIKEEEPCPEAEIVKTTEGEDISGLELSAYIDNELSEEHNIKIRKSLLAKPKIRNRLEKMYKLKKILSDSFVEQRSKLKTDYSKEIVKSMNKDISTKQIYFHCAAFIFVVITALALSVWAIISVL